MSFATHTFETNPSTENGAARSYSFHDVIGEGTRAYLLLQFQPGSHQQREIAETLYDSFLTAYEESPGTSTYDRFEDALRAVNTEAEKLRPHLSEPPNALIALFDFYELYLSQSGTAEAYLLREDSLSQITESAGTGGKLFEHILSGTVQVGDAILFSSTRVLRYLTPNQLRLTLSQSDFTAAVSDLRHELTLHAPEDIIMTCIGIARNDTHARSAGFLHRDVEHQTLPPATESAMQVQEYPPEDDQTPHMVPPVQPIHATFPRSSRRKAGQRDWLGKLSSGGRGAWQQAREGLIRLLNRYGIRPKHLLIVIGVVIGSILLVRSLTGVSPTESESTAELRLQKEIGYEALAQAGRFLLEGKRNEANEYLTRAENAAKTILSTNNEVYRYDATKILEEVKEKRMSVENAEQASQRIMADISLKADNVDALGMTQVGDALYVYERRGVFEVLRSVVGTATGIVTENENLLSIAGRDGQKTLVVMTDTPRIIEYRDGVATRMDTEDTTWKRGIDLKTYLDKYIYVLDPVENQIWKYERLRTQYGPASPYNIDSRGDLSRAVSMAIDGSIYVITDNGEIQKYMRGEAVDLDILDLPSIAMSGAGLRIFTTNNHDLLYVLDPENQRILLFGKDANTLTYKRQVLFDIPDARDFYVNESGLRAYVLTKEKVYELEL
ncbi:hypothetical protein H6771_01130 [Candidatus Peribacteria bacterium]|nr:hypothetical protein [Candidatus Peribacteria bacterium]